MCNNETEQFNACFSNFRKAQAAKKAQEAKGVLPTGPKASFTGVQMNNFMKQFPLSGRTRQEYVDPKFEKWTPDCCFCLRRYFVVCFAIKYSVNTNAATSLAWIRPVLKGLVRQQLNRALSGWSATLFSQTLWIVFSKEQFLDENLTVW